MTTREQLIDGFRMIIREGLRTTRDFGPDDWKYVVHDEEGGWNVKQVYCHLAATADIVPGFVGALAQAQEGQNTAASLDIDALNAQGVAAREKMSEPELMEAFKTSHEKLIEFLQGVPEEQLEQRRRFGTLEAPVADHMATLVLHGLSHIYHAQSRPLG
jgi:uncharacterized damage-inducible protein DinB